MSVIFSSKLFYDIDNNYERMFSIQNIVLNVNMSFFLYRIRKINKKKEPHHEINGTLIMRKQLFRGQV